MVDTLAIDGGPKAVTNELAAWPQFDEKAIAAQLRWSEISGHRKVHYCGAYWRYGFHEDGVNSALAVGKAFGVTL